MHVICPDIRYSLRAKRIFNELHEQPFVVELDLRGTSYPLSVHCLQFTEYLCGYVLKQFFYH